MDEHCDEQKGWNVCTRRSNSIRTRKRRERGLGRTTSIPFQTNPGNKMAKFQPFFVTTWVLREGTFFLGGGGRAGASEGRVNSESEHQKGRAIPHVRYSRRVTHLFQIF